MKVEKSAHQVESVNYGHELSLTYNSTVNLWKFGLNFGKIGVKLIFVAKCS